MVAGQANKMRKSTLRNTAARVLVLGHQQAGKSAAIVRYTTGRFIQNYCSATNDWLYRHPIGYDSTRNQYKLVELLEQKDIEFSNSVSRDEEEEQQQEVHQPHQQQRQHGRQTPSSCSLSSRVALDRQIDHEFYEKQQLLNKLHWANAYVILYALNDSRSFNKAIKYLNLIANEVNRQPTHQHSPARRPILLVGNKRDLTHSVNTSQLRRVSHSDGRLLAMRHHCLFAELSISEAATPIEQAISNLVESIRATDLHTTRINNLSLDLNEQILTQTQLTYWIPLSVCQVYEQQQQHHHQNNQHSNQTNLSAPGGQQPVWSTLVKTRLPQSYSSVSQNIVQSSCLAIKAKRLNEADFRLLTPVGMSLSSGSSSSTSSSSGSGGGGSIGSGVVSSALVVKVKQQPQVAQPLLASAAPPLADVMQTTPAMSVIESVSVAQRMVATRPSVSSLSSVSSVSGGSNSGKSHLSSFRSSFRKGALAIVGSRSLAARVTSSGAGSGANKENERRLTKTTPRSSLSSIQNQDTLSSISHTTASDSDTSSAGTIGASRRHHSIETEGNSKKASGQRINWIKSKISSLGRQETSASNSDTNSIGHQSLNEQQAAVSRFRRPLFKYRSRRKTVAFEPTFETNESPSSGSLAPEAKRTPDEHSHGACLVRVSPAASESISASQSDLTTPAQPGASLMGNPLRETRNHSFNALHDTRESSCLRSDSSLSTNTCGTTTASSSNVAATTQALSSVFIVDAVGPTNFTIQRAASTGICLPSARGPGQRDWPKTTPNTSTSNNSHSTLSRASTSGGSYDDDDDSELESDHRQGRSPGLAVASRCSGGANPLNSLPGPIPTASVRPVKARYQLVKTVQSTLTSLAKAAGGQSPPSSALGSTQPVKRSFCNALFNRNNATLPAPVIADRLQFVAGTTVGSSQMAQAERIQTLPLMGFCK